MDSQNKKDKTDVAINDIRIWREQRIKGSMTLHFDGSGKVAVVEETIRK